MVIENIEELERKIREKEYQKYLPELNAKKPKRCLRCNKVLKNTRKKTCSKECERKQKNMTTRRSKKKIMKKFHKYKTSRGCFMCNYNKYGGAIDFHHLWKKSFGITASKWHVMSKKTKKEIGKCVLLCKTCHKEVTDITEEAKKLGIKFIDTDIEKEVNRLYLDKKIVKLFLEQGLSSAQNHLKTIYADPLFAYLITENIIRKHQGKKFKSIGELEPMKLIATITYEYYTIRKK